MKFFRLVSLCLSLCLGTACSLSEDINIECESSSPILTDNNICLVIENKDQLSKYISTIEAKVIETVSIVTDLIKLNNLTIRVRHKPSATIPEIGIGGYNPASDEVIISINKDFPNIDVSLEIWLGATLAHEMHHAARRRTVGYGSTLLEAMVTEGLADWFSMEATGIAPPPWSTALDQSELEKWKEAASQIWTKSPYDHSRWFFGSGDVPRWAGYSIGYELVKDYLAANPGEKASSLLAEPATSFKP